MWTVALANGRVLAEVRAYLACRGLPVPPPRPDLRRLIYESDRGDLRYLLVKPDDVPTYVARHVAHYGFVGSDVLDETAQPHRRIHDLGVGRCRMSLAGPPSLLDDWRRGRLPEGLLVASRYPRTAHRHLQRLGIRAGVIPMHGAVEVAACSGLADAVVDLVATGSTLRKNGLVEIEVLEPEITVWLIGEPPVTGCGQQTPFEAAVAREC